MTPLELALNLVVRGHRHAVTRLPSDYLASSRQGASQVDIKRRRPSAPHMRKYLVLFVTAACVLLSRTIAAQGLTGALIGTVKDAQGGVLPGAVVRVSSPALIGGPATVTTNEKGQLRFPALPPGLYVLDIELQGFATLHEEDIRIGAGATIERTVVLKLAGLAESVVVEGAGSRIEARDPGFGTRFGPEDLKSDPDATVEHVRLDQGRPWSLAHLAVERHHHHRVRVRLRHQREPVSHRRHELHLPVQRRRASRAGRRLHSGSAGPVRRGVRRVRQRAGRRDQRHHQAGKRAVSVRRVVLRADGRPDQPAGPAPIGWPGTGQSGYERARYRDFTTNLGGPVVRDRLWFFAGYQYLRDYDSQPGTDPAFPRTYEQDKIFAKLTWKLTPGLQLVQSFHDEFWVNPDPPTLVTPFEATLRRSASVPAMTFGHLTHTLSANTVWDVRVGRFVYSERARTEHRRSDDAEPVRPRDGCHQRRSAAVRRTDADSHDRQGDHQPLPAWAVGRRSPVEDGRASRTGRAPRRSTSFRPA